jgi:hypothetical protein
MEKIELYTSAEFSDELTDILQSIYCKYSLESVKSLDKQMFTKAMQKRLKFYRVTIEEIPSE